MMRNELLEISPMTDPAQNVTIQQQPQNMADGLNIIVWITADGKVVQNKPPGGIEVRPRAGAGPSDHGSPAETKPDGDGT
jgi:hypothetical protein